jgi:hypothetical protein
MADDELFFRENRPPTPSRQPQPGELLFEFHVERTHTFYRVELRDHGPVYGVEAQFIDPIDLRMSRTFRAADDPTGTRTPRAMAIGWAEAEHASLMERDGD